jgi:hypothetical protein
VFYPNDFDHYFKSSIRPKTLGFPVLSQVTENDIWPLSLRILTEKKASSFWVPSMAC